MIDYILDREALKKVLSWINQHESIGEKERDRHYLTFEMLGLPIGYGEEQELILTDGARYGEELEKR